MCGGLRRVSDPTRRQHGLGLRAAGRRHQPQQERAPGHLSAPARGLEAKALVEADIVVFDGSDLAPGAVGGDAMFVALQDFVAEPDTIGDILEFLEDAADNAY